MEYIREAPPLKVKGLVHASYGGASMYIFEQDDSLLRITDFKASYCRRGPRPWEPGEYRTCVTIYLHQGLFTCPELSVLTPVHDYCIVHHIFLAPIINFVFLKGGVHQPEGDHVGEPCSLQVHRQPFLL
jgi:hypothetical protein